MDTKTRKSLTTKEDIIAHVLDWTDRACHPDNDGIFEEAIAAVAPTIHKYPVDVLAALVIEFMRNEKKLCDQLLKVMKAQHEENQKIDECLSRIALLAFNKSEATAVH